jgi:hypothetical protein
MNRLLVTCAAVAIACVATYILVSNQKTAQFNKEREFLRASWEAERAELEAAIRSARGRGTPVAVASRQAGAAQSSGKEILERLGKMKVLSGEQKAASVRRIIHELESLADLGPEALPAIREFLGKFEDVEYSGEARDEDKPRDAAAERGSLPGVPGRSAPRLDTVLPPSLRLGLVQVLKEMGGEQAEAILAEMLSTTGRGVEIAYVAKALQEMVPNKYRDVAVTAAKDILANPPAVDRPNRLDDNAKNFLYGVLNMYEDTTAATVAQSQLVTADGRVDRTALSYLTGTLKEDAVPALYQAFKDDRMTNMWERASLATQILSYAGANQQANDILKEVVGNESLPSWLRATAIQTVAGGRGNLFGGATPSDPSQIKARIDLLNSLGEINDERLARAKVDAIQKLSDQAAESDGTASGRSFRNRLDGGQGAASEMPPLPPGAR